MDCVPFTLTEDEEIRSRYQALFECANDAVFVLAPTGQIIEANHAAVSLLGVPIDDIVGRSFTEFIDPPHVDREWERFDRLISEGTLRVEGVVLKGRETFVDVSAAVAEVGGGRVVFAILRDVTEQLRIQAQLQMSDRMVAIGMLAAGVAHELNNPLSAVIANLELALHQLAAPAPKEASLDFETLIEELSDAREAAHQVKQIIRDLRIFSRRDSEATGPVDVVRVVESSVRMAWNEVRHRATLVKDFKKVPAIGGSESRLAQVVLNLVVNAAQAIPEGHANENTIAVKTALDESGRVSIEVSDTGAGMTPEVLARLFTPFFTTKPAGVGTGLGLSICRRIVSELGGEIRVASAPGRGSTFRVLLPCTALEQTRKHRPPSKPPRSRAKILVVDDQPLVAKGIARLLSAHHDVRTFTSAKKAFDLLGTGERFDVALVDLMMPEMTGMEFFELLRNTDPGLAQRLVFLTGGAFTQSCRDFLEHTSNPILEKPIDLPKMREIVDECVRRATLDAPASESASNAAE
jgi:PAS domain S-box-containing protein